MEASKIINSWIKEWKKNIKKLKFIYPAFFSSSFPNCRCIVIPIEKMKKEEK